MVDAARLYGGRKPASILYAMGITQHSHGTDNVLAIANLAMLTGNLGRPSSGVNPLRGQNNVQGACDMGALPDVYPGYQRVADPAAQSKFERAWGVPLPTDPGLRLLEIFQAAGDQVKACYLVGENPMLSDPDLRHAEQALRRLDFLVVQDIFLTETARLAHVILPAASFAEKDGTFTNTERRVQRVRQAIAPVGSARPDWRIICELAKRMGAGGFEFGHPLEVMEEISRLAPIYGGISYERLNGEGLQWPCPTADHPGTPVLHAERFARGKGRFSPLRYEPPGEERDAGHPLILTTERSLYQYHTGSMTRRSTGLNQLDGEGFVEMHPDDALAFCISEGEKVRVVSRRGEVMARAKITAASPPGVVCMNFHFAEMPTNILTNPAVDPHAGTPELKLSAVRLEKLLPAAA